MLHFFGTSLPRPTNYKISTSVFFCSRSCNRHGLTAAWELLINMLLEKEAISSDSILVSDAVCIYSKVHNSTDSGEFIGADVDGELINAMLFLW